MYIHIYIKYGVVYQLFQAVVSFHLTWAHFWQEYLLPSVNQRQVMILTTCFDVQNLDLNPS